METHEDHGHPFVIAVGVDYSDSAKHVLYLARSLARGHDDFVVHAVHVTSLPSLTETVTHIDVRDELERVRHVCQPVAADLARNMRCHVIVGRVDQELVRFACDCGADLLVIGARDRSAIERLVSGSTSSKIMRAAPCSVVVARPNDRLAESSGALEHARPPRDGGERERDEEADGGERLSDQMSQ